MNWGERANMPTRQPSCASFLTSAAPSPGPTPATIATRSCRILVILCFLFGFTALLSRATLRREGKQVSVARTEYPKTTPRAHSSAGVHVQAARRLAIVTGVAHETAGRTAFQV